MMPTPTRNGRSHQRRRRRRAETPRLRGSLPRSRRKSATNPPPRSSCHRPWKKMCLPRRVALHLMTSHGENLQLSWRNCSARMQATGSGSSRLTPPRHLGFSCLHPWTRPRARRRTRQSSGSWATCWRRTPLMPPRWRRPRPRMRQRLPLRAPKLQSASAFEFGSASRMDERGLLENQTWIPVVGKNQVGPRTGPIFSAWRSTKRTLTRLLRCNSSPGSFDTLQRKSATQEPRTSGRARRSGSPCTTALLAK
mmetsp:Transcript_1778/g.5241  ORF Transcript_1778/g.5241 Transcript_1778/m.5241 type:complete len:252 (-) Transcript_1778:569-1324(-)